MSRSLQLRALLSLLSLLSLGAMTPGALVARHPDTQICHHPSPHHMMELWVDDAALDGHMGHGDTLGPCVPVTPTATPT